MAANNETRILKSNSIEELRQKSNEISFGLGDKKLLDSDIADKIFTHTASAGDYLVSPANTRFEYKPEETVDNTAGYILLTGSPTIPGGFAAGASLTQSGGYSATIVSSSTTKILVKNSSGTFDSTAQITAGSDNIAGSAIRSLVAESYKKGEVIVKVGGTEYTQDATSTTGFHVPNHAGSITLTSISSAADVSDFEEGAVAYQGTNLASATFSGTILDCSTTLLRLKTTTGSFNASTVIKVDGGSDTIAGSKHGDITNEDQTHGRLIEFNTPLSASDAVQIISTNLVDAINEVQDDIGTIGSLASGISNRTDIVNAVNSLKTEIGTASLDTSATSLRGGINELHTEVNSNDTDIATINTKLGTITAGAMGTTASTVSTAIAELHTDVDARLMLTKGSSQTINGDISFSNAKTFTFPSGSTLDIRQGSLLTGSGGGELTFDTAFLTLTVNDDNNSAVNQFGLEGRRAGSGTDVRVQWNETQVSGNKEARAWQIQGLDDSGSSNTADLVTFYNAKELFANNTETGVAVVWDPTNQNFDINLDADPTIQLSGDIGGSVTLSDLQTATYTLATTIQAGSVENSMLAGSIAASKLAGSIPNSKLANDHFTITDGTNSTDVALNDTLTIQGTAGEIEVVENAKTVTIGLPTNADIDGNLVVGGNLTVSGTQTILNTDTLTVEDTLVLAGNALTSEPSSGGFGIEAGPIITQTVNGAVSSSTSVTLDSGTGVLVGQGVYGTGVASGATVSAISGTTLTLSAASSIADGATLSFSHPTRASNVTGSHSIVYNYGTDRWEADGSLILSEATLGVPSVAVDGGSNIDLSSTRRLHFSDGAGINITGALNSNDIDISVINTDKGSDQTFYKTFNTDSGNIAASANNDTITVTGGNDLTVSGSSDTLTIQHDNSGATAGSYGAQHTVPAITVDARGHITSVSNSSAITLASLGYTGSATANNYQFTIDGDSGSSNVIANGETFEISGAGSSVSGASENNVETVVSNNKITIKTKNTEYSVEDGGLTQKNFTTVLKNKLDAIDANANNYQFILAATGTSGTQTISDADTLTFTGAGATTITRSGAEITITGANTTYSAATTSAEGLMSAADKSKLNGITAGATATAAPHYTSAIGSSDVTGALGFTPYNATNPSGFTSNAGTVTGLTPGNGIGISGSAPSPGVGLNGTYTGTWQVTGAITATGNITAFASDVRLKDRKANIANALEKVESLSGFNYTFNETGLGVVGEDYRDEEQIGVSAQEVEAVLPEVVKPAPGNSDYKTVQYEKLVPLLIEAIKELNAEIKDLKSINNT